MLMFAAAALVAGCNKNDNYPSTDTNNVSSTVNSNTNDMNSAMTATNMMTNDMSTMSNSVNNVPNEITNSAAMPMISTNQ
jgi:hypothetical protein